MPHTKLALLCMHGMGNLKAGEFNTQIAKLRSRLNVHLTGAELSELYIHDDGIRNIAHFRNVDHGK